MPSIITIIVTYNGERWIKTCLDCMIKSTLPTEILIIDNASNDSTKNIIRQQYPDILLIQNNANIGFGQANNIGIEYALKQKADYIFLLNQDAYIFTDTLETLVAAHNRHPGYGIISPLQMDAKGIKPDILFRKFISNNYSPDFICKIEIRDPNLPEVFPVRFVNATSWFISMECVKTTGLFCPVFYHYGEDNHYCSRAQYHGFKVGIATKTAVRHDKTYKNNREELLLRKIHLDPLYILLDIRKGIGIAYLSVFWKLTGYTWKGLYKGSPVILNLTIRKAYWVFTHFALILKIRKESKISYIKNIA